MKKLLSLLLIAFSLFALSTLLVSCASDKADDSNLTLREKIQKEDFEDLSLTLYYVDNPLILRSFPWSAEQLHKGAKRITITGEKLEKALPLLYKLDDMLDDLTAKKSSSSYMDAFLGYTLESSESGVFLDVILSSGGGGMAIVNGVEMSSDNIVFYEIFREFLPEDVLENWKLHFEAIEKLSR